MKNFEPETHVSPNPESTRTVLSEEAWDKLQEVIANPKPPTKAMMELMSEGRLKKGNRVI